MPCCLSEHDQNHFTDTLLEWADNIPSVSADSIGTYMPMEPKHTKINTKAMFLAKY